MPFAMECTPPARSHEFPKKEIKHAFMTLHQKTEVSRIPRSKSSLGRHTSRKREKEITIIGLLTSLSSYFYDFFKTQLVEKPEASMRLTHGGDQSCAALRGRGGGGAGMGGLLSQPIVTSR